MLERTSAVLGLLVATAAPAAAQSTWHVDAGGFPPGSGTPGDPYTSVQYALAQPTTLPGDTVLVAQGTYTESIDFLGKEVVVRGTGGPALTVLEGDGAGPVVRFVNGEGAAAVLEGFTVRGGDGRTGTPALDVGGGVHCDGTSPTLRDLVVEGNTSLRGGGLHFRNGSMATLVDSVVRDNNELVGHNELTESQGGGVWASCDSHPRVERVDFLQNVRSRGGGAYGAGTYRDCLFDGNTGYEGGGLYAPVGCDLQVFDSAIQNNHTCVDSDCGRGGGVFGPAQLFDCFLFDNFALRSGGGAEGATLVRCTLRANRALPNGSFPGRGGGASTSTLVDCLVEGNRAVGQDAIFNTALGGGLAECDATDTRLVGNVAQNGRGGGAWGSTLLRCTVEDNEATQVNPSTPSGGGGLAECDAERTLVWKNRAGRGGGVWGGSTVHCVVIQNTASIENGGVEAGNSFSFGSATLLNSVVRDNDAPQLLATNGTLTATSCDVEGGWPGAGNFDADPLFWLPATGDVHLKPGSPCIDAGNPMSPPDPGGSVADVGIHPFDPSYCPDPRTYCVPKVNSVGCSPGLAWSGTPSLSDGQDLVVEAFLVRNSQNGTLFTGAGPAAAPFQGGTLCVAPPLVRVATQGSGGTPPGTQDCTGTYAFVLGPATVAQLGIAAGDTRVFQILYRDPPHPDGSGVGLTDALEVGFCP